MVLRAGQGVGVSGSADAADAIRHGPSDPSNRSRNGVNAHVSRWRKKRRRTVARLERGVCRAISSTWVSRSTRPTKPRPFCRSPQLERHGARRLGLRDWLHPAPRRPTRSTTRCSTTAALQSDNKRDAEADARWFGVGGRVGVYARQRMARRYTGDHGAYPSPGTLLSCPENAPIVRE